MQLPHDFARTRSLSSQVPRRFTRALPLLSGTVAVASLAAYFLYPDESRSAPTSKDTPISPTHFTPATLISTEVCNHDTKLLKLRIPKHLIPSPETNSGLFKPVWSVYVKDDDIQVERPYTPLEGIDEDGTMLFWIKKYPKGEVGRWLHSKRAGDTVELRGPLQTWHWEAGIWDEVVMISGGTGITPFYQLFNSVIRDSVTSDTRFTLLHSSKSSSDLPPPSMMHPMTQYASQHPERFKMHLFVDVADKESSATLPPLNEGRIDKRAIEKITGKDEQRSLWTKIWSSSRKPSSQPKRQRILFLVCGPEPYACVFDDPISPAYSHI
ncbi:hypothetical protein ONZ45_g15637 [Pleurotus djamor]|nr:hypothetical protein ONZ45_g15637 [Pleurotus djamor]